MSKDAHSPYSARFPSAKAERKEEGMGLLTWIIFGALAGWIASLILGRNRQMGCLANILVGVAGALIGGFLVGLVSRQSFITRFDLTSLIVAVLGAVVLLFLTGMFSRRRA